VDGLYRVNFFWKVIQGIKISNKSSLPNLPNLPNGIFLSHSIGVESSLPLFHRDEIFFALISLGRSGFNLSLLPSLLAESTICALKLGGLSLREKLNSFQKNN
jgi:hypothetical protein